MLLSLSNPLPTSASSPPGSIVVLSEVEDALRSILWLEDGLDAAGVGAGKPSRSIALPIPTLSTSVPTELYINTVLLSERIVGPEYV